MRYISVIFLVITLSAYPAQEVQQGQLYQANTPLKSSQFGITFTIPDHWQGMWPQGSEFFILERQNPVANIFILIEQVSDQELQQLMSQPIPLDQSLILKPIKSPQKQHNFWWGDYSVSNSPELAAHIAATNGSNKTTVAFIGISPVQSKQTLTETLQHLSKQLTFNPISNSGQKQFTQQNNPQNKGQKWNDYLKGRYLIRLYTGSGYSEKEELWLCSNGVFHRSSNSGGYTAGVASGSFGSQNSGRWQAQGVTNQTGQLILRYGDGSTGSYQLSFDGDKLYLNSSRWFRDRNDYCQ